MHYDNIDWTRETYQNFLVELDRYADTKYQKFQQGLIPNGQPLRGIRTPQLKIIAKSISKGNYQAFFNQVTPDSYEEIIIYGLVISYLKVPFETTLHLLNSFVSMIDNWAINDIVAANLKCFQKNQEAGLKYIKNLINSQKPWSIRFGLVLLLGHYINDTYIDRVLEIANQITHEEYYVKMANAWLISICYIKYREKTKCFLKETVIDDWTYNKAISKICDSRQVNQEEKDNLRTFKRQ